MKEDFLCYPNKAAKHRLIMLHGWGAEANDLIPLGRTILRNIELPFELISLEAPYLRPEGSGRQWYGLFPPDWLGVPKAIYDLKIRIEILGRDSIPLKDSILLGFSQGAAMAISVGSNLPLGGIISCSGYPHPDLKFKRSIPPLLLSHGLNDDVVPIEASYKLEKLLKEGNHKYIFHSFKGGHEIPEGILPLICQNIENWLYGY
tara:strand:- start:454 stop:1065 length:612 start_codon:yes stop_codon:yes gene_type:complete